MKTVSAKSHEVKRDWLLVDAKDATLGRLASGIAHRLRGKHKTIYTPHVDTGDYIVLLMQKKLKLLEIKLKIKFIIDIPVFQVAYIPQTLPSYRLDFQVELLKKQLKACYPKGH